MGSDNGFSNYTALVTGGAGAIGSRLTRRLLEHGVSKILVVDDLSSGFDWLVPDDSRVTFDRKNVNDFFNESPEFDVDVVFHLAAFFANQNSVDHPEEDLMANGMGTLKALKWSAEHEVKRFVYASAGCSIAGHDVEGPIREDMPVSLWLDTPYQITKALGEFYCNYFQKGVNTVRCRFFNSYGPGEVPGTYRNVIPNFVWHAIHNQPLIITGTGNETRDFIFVDDLVDGLVASSLRLQANGEAFNFGTGIQSKVIDLAHLIIDKTNSKSEITFTSRRAWDNSVVRQADLAKSRSVLSFDPQIRLSDGLDRTVEWFRENYDQIKYSTTFR